MERVTTVASHFVPADSERLIRVLRFFELTGTPLQIKTADLAEALEMPAQAVSRWVGWAEKYGILDVERTADGFATGRSPNTYTLRITEEQWRDQGEDIIAALKVRPAPPVEVKSLPSTPGKPDDLAADVRPQAAELVREAIAEAGPLPHVEVPPPMSDDEVEHWLSIED